MRSSREPRRGWTTHTFVGLQYGVTAAAFLAAGFLLMLLFRWQLAWPGRPLPGFAASLAGPLNAPGGVMVPEFYNQLVAMHGTVMIFLAVVPLLVGAFGTYVVPLQIGAPNTVFPRLSAAGYWTYLVAGLCMLGGFFADGGAANSGWTSYPPLAVIATHGQDFWLVGIFLLGVSSMLAATVIITTIVQARTEGMRLMRMPFFVWAELIAALLLLLAFPALQAAGLLQLMDRQAGTSFFMPGGLVVGGVPVEGLSGGGSPLLWQHLFWFLAHPEVYVLVLPAMGIVAEVLPANARRPLWGYGLMVGAVLFLGVMSLVVWAHHMFLTGMGPALSGFFQVTTMIISVPSVVLITALVLTLWGGSIRFPVSMLFALAFLPMFGIGGLTGLPLGLAASDVLLHDTYYVVGHFHYLVAPGTLFAIFAGVYHWYPRMTGRRLSERLGRLHFWGSFVAMNALFFPMFGMGLTGVNRRLFDAGQQYAHAAPSLPWNAFMTWSAVALGLFQLPFLVNLIRSRRHGAPAGDNPWSATTLEWRPASAPAVAHGKPYEYSVPGATTDFTPQWAAADDADDSNGREPEGTGEASLAEAQSAKAEAHSAKADTGMSSVRLGTSLFVASDAMFLGALASSFVLLAAAGPAPSAADGATMLSMAAGVAIITAWVALAKAVSLGAAARARRLLMIGAAAAAAAGLAEAGAMAVAWAGGATPADHVLTGMWFVMTGVQAVHALAGACLIAWLVPHASTERSVRFASRLDAVRLFWHLVAAAWVVIALLVWWY